MSLLQAPKPDIKTKGVNSPFNIALPGGRGVKTVTTKDQFAAKGKKRPTEDFGDIFILDFLSTSTVDYKLGLLNSAALTYAAGTLFAGDNTGLTSAGAGTLGEITVLVNGGAMTLEQFRAIMSKQEPHVHNFFYNLVSSASQGQYAKRVELLYATASGTQSRSLANEIKAGDTKSNDGQLSRLVEAEFHLNVIQDMVITVGAGFAFSIELHIPNTRFEHKR